MTGEDIQISVLLDENVDKEVLAYLQSDGHDGSHVVDVLDPGVEDAADIAPFARKQESIIVTKDTDFLAMDMEEHAGVFFITLQRGNPWL